MRQALEPVGWQVTEAENGQVAVEAITAARPEVIILDLMMPKMESDAATAPSHSRDGVAPHGKQHHRDPTAWLGW